MGNNKNMLIGVLSVNIWDISNVLRDIKKVFTVVNNNVFIFKQVNVQNKYILTFNISNTNVNLDKVKQKLNANAIVLHRKRQHNVIFTINGLNKLLESIEGDDIPWQNYANSLIVTQYCKQFDQCKLNIINIETVKIKNLDLL